MGSFDSLRKKPLRVDDQLLLLEAVLEVRSETPEGWPDAVQRDGGLHVLALRQATAHSGRGGTTDGRAATLGRPNPTGVAAGPDAG